MFKKTFLLLFTLLCNATLYPHGFGSNVFITLSNHYYQTIKNLSRNTIVQKSHPSVLTYKEKTKEYRTTRVKSVAKGKTNCYFKIGFDKRIPCTDVICTPAQEFYSTTANEWIPAYQLQINDELLGKDNKSIAITYIELVNEPLNVFIIEVQKTHTFFVGKHSVLTHNIILPINISMSIPFGSITGGTIGGFFGPLTCTIGIIAGSAIGAIIKIFNDDKIPKYKLPHYDIAYINQQRNNLTHLNDKNKDAQAPGIPTENDGFEPPKRWDGKKVKNPNGLGWGWQDRKGQVWVPTGPNGHGGPHWDVQDPKTGRHRNVLPGGKIR